MKLTGDLSGISGQLKEGLLRLGEFVGADEVEFQDHGNGEDITITKGSDKFTIKARGTKCDGGFFGYAYEGQPPPMTWEEAQTMGEERP